MSFCSLHMTDISKHERQSAEQSQSTLWISALLLQNILRQTASLISLMKVKKSTPAQLRLMLKLRARTKNGFFSLKTKHTTILQKSNHSVVRQPVSVVQSVTRCQDVRMFMRQCVLPVQLTHLSPFPRQLRVNFLRERLLPVRQAVTVHTATRLVLQQVR